jgi:Tol biopolymer transport system component
VYYADKTSRPQRLLRLPVEGGTPVEIGNVPEEGLVGAVAVSPDGKFLAFPYHESGPKPLQRLVVVPVDGGAPVKSFVGITGFLRWTPDGRGINYYAMQNGIRQIFEQPLAGGAPHPVTRFTSDKIHDFEWSEDGKQLYVSHGEISSDAVLITNVH